MRERKHAGQRLVGRRAGGRKLERAGAIMSQVLSELIPDALRSPALLSHVGSLASVGPCACAWACAIEPELGSGSNRATFRAVSFY